MFEKFTYIQIWSLKTNKYGLFLVPVLCFFIFLIIILNSFF